MCFCKQSYVHETVRNAQIKCGEHDDAKKSSEPANCLKESENHEFIW